MSNVLSNITHNNDNFLDSNITHDINNNKPIDNNVPTQLCEIDFLDIDDQDLLSAFDDIEIQQYGVSSGNTNVMQTENTCRNTIHAVSNPVSHTRFPPYSVFSPEKWVCTRFSPRKI